MQQITPLVIVSAAEPLSFQVVRSDTDCEGSSESETQKENMVQKVQKKTVDIPRPDFIVEDQCSNKDELVRNVQNINLTCTGTVMDLWLQQQITIDTGSVVSSNNNESSIWYWIVNSVFVLKRISMHPHKTPAQILQQ